MEARLGSPLEPGDLRNLGDPISEVWLRELETPSPAFFEAFLQRAAGPEGPRNAARDAVQNLTPLVDWAAYLPHIPHGLLGLGAVFRLRPLLAGRSFLRILATQLHAFAVEAPKPARQGPGGHQPRFGLLGEPGAGPGYPPPRPGVGGGAWGRGGRFPAFRRLEGRVEKDMANVGHKAVMARELGELFLTLDAPRAGGRVLLALAAWLCASEPFDTFWHQRASRRLEGVAPVPHRPSEASPDALKAGARVICDSGLVDLLDGFALTVKAGAGSGDLLAQLVLAASEKQLDARRDLEGKTSWNFVLPGPPGQAGRR